MIEKTTVEGRPALVSYLNDKLEMVDRSEATLVKVIFTDDEAGVVFAKVGGEAARAG